MRESRRAKSDVVLDVLLAAAIAFCGVLMSYFGYIWGSASPNPGEILGSILFWGGVVYLLLGNPLRRAVADFGLAVRTRLGAGVFLAYLTVHLILYGFLLEVILATSFGSSLLVVPQQALFIRTDTFLPPSLTSTLFDLSFNPSIVLTVQPLFTAALSMYSISMALIIAVLVVANVGRTRELGKLVSARKRAATFVALPALGIVLGASCCLSVAGIISLYALPLATYSALASSLWLFYVTYFGLPSFAVAILFLNLRSVRKLTFVVGNPLGQRVIIDGSARSPEG